MDEIKKERNEFKLFNKTESGASKLALFIMGIILGLVSSTLFGYMCGNYNATGDYRYYDWLLFVAIFLLILTGELIGIYFGAYEEFHLMKKRQDLEKEKLENNNVVAIKKEEKEVIKPLVKEDNKTVKRKKTVSSKKTAVKKEDNKKKETSSSKTNKKATTKRKTAKE